MINLASRENPDGMNVTVRGLTQPGIEMRQGIRIAQRPLVPGGPARSGGRQFHRRTVIPEAAIGNKIRFGRGEWEIVGVMDAGRGAQASEIWGDLNQIAADQQRLEVLSSALVRATDPVAAEALVNDINNDQRLNMKAVPEAEYYAAQNASAAPIEFVGIFVSIIMAVGSSFAAMNTMYAAVARRAREIGTLRVLGFSRGSILFSFFVESVLLSGLGGRARMPAGAAAERHHHRDRQCQLQRDGVQLPRVSADHARRHRSSRIVLGALGGLFPARMASRKEILTALREV